MTAEGVAEELAEATDTVEECGKHEAAPSSPDDEERRRRLRRVVSVALGGSRVPVISTDILNGQHSRRTRAPR